MMTDSGITVLPVGVDTQNTGIPGTLGTGRVLVRDVVADVNTFVVLRGNAALDPRPRIVTGLCDFGGKLYGKVDTGIMAVHVHAKNGMRFTVVDAYAVNGVRIICCHFSSL